MLRRKLVVLSLVGTFLTTAFGYPAEDSDGATSSSNVTDSEQGRFLLWGKPILIVPPTAPTRHQLISGIGIPLGTPESITTGWVIKAQYFLPTSVNDLKPTKWEGWNETRRTIEKRSVPGTPEGQYEQYTASQVNITEEKLPEPKLDDDYEEDEDDEFEDGDENYWMDEDEKQLFQDIDEKFPAVQPDPEQLKGYNAGNSRWLTYKTLEKIGESYGCGGRACVLRSICEAADAEFSHTGGVFAELMHVIFTPSSTTEPLSEHSDNEYFRAEQLGREGAPCALIFKECKHSILDVFTGVHDPSTNALLLAHQKVLQSIMK
ncbi:uncharacterized protein LOC129756738 [Uranotaenia lowii]|uniref:uncharacterized protein LOC129756738 n=1 Tax=Uranotaenia lowii TaxID=190385 RepID=UPI00247A6393|nr:uncharacterized protein LOC129756738 [Uranotaenia lowii]